VVNNLTEQGHEAVAGAPHGRENAYRQGLAEVLKGAQSRRCIELTLFEDRGVMDFFKTTPTTFSNMEPVLAWDISLRCP